jgi:hypothetical protein
MLMTMLAAVIYAAGQMMGAETRARANVWATAALTGAMMAILISVVAPSVIGAVYGQTITCSGGGGCFLPGTLVQTPAGGMRIEELMIGDEVYSFAENMEVSISRVSAKYVSGRCAYYTINAGDYEVNVTAEHPFFTPGGYQEAAGLAAGDVVLIYQNGALAEKTIMAVSRVNASTEVYNLQVALPGKN